MQTTTTPNALVAAEPITHDALLEIGFEGNLVEGYSFVLDPHAVWLLFAFPVGGCIDKVMLVLTGDNSTSGHATTIEEVLAFNEQALIFIEAGAPDDEDEENAPLIARQPAPARQPSKTWEWPTYSPSTPKALRPGSQSMKTLPWLAPKRGAEVDFQNIGRE